LHLSQFFVAETFEGRCTEKIERYTETSRGSSQSSVALQSPITARHVRLACWSKTSAYRLLHEDKALVFGTKDCRLEFCQIDAFGKE
jgi:hypothetical protein